MLQKAIQKINQAREVRKSTSQQHFHFALHRGPEESSSDPYSYRRKLCIPRCSGVGYIAKQKYARIFGIASLSILIILLTLAACPVVLTDPSAEATAGTPTASTTTLDMTLGKSSARLNIMPKDESGTFASSTTTELAEFGVTTNNYTGYTLTISGSNDNGLLINTDTSITTNNTLSSISTVIDSATFDATAYNGKWGYRPSKYNGIDNASFRPSPTTTASTLDTTTVANTTTPNMYTIGLGARVDYTKPAGTYSNTFTLSAVARPVGYSITYADDTADATVANLPSFGGDTSNHTQTGSVSTTSVTLSSTIPTRTNYTFKSWCLGSTTSNGTVCSTGLEYNAGGEFGIDQTIAGIYTINAVWTYDLYTITYGTVTGIDSVSLNSTNCTTALSSGGCNITLTRGNTYNLVATPSTGYSFTSWNAGDYGAIADTTLASTTYTAGAGSSTITPTATINTYSLAITFAGDGVSNVKVCKVAGSCTGTDLMGTISTSGGSVSNLVYNTAYYLYPTFTSASYGLDNWAKTDTTAGSALSSTSDLNPTYTIGVGNGAVTITGKTSCQTTVSGNMQDFSPCSSVATGTSGTLTDSRDNQQYTVAKIGSKWFMTRNLAIGCNGSGSSYGSSVSSKSLDSTTSNVDTTWSTPTDLLTNPDYSSSTSGYTTAAMMCNSTYGAWYNYKAATAGTISTDSNTTEASYSICPKGWKLPTNSEFTTLKDTSGSTTSFSPVTGGNYFRGYLEATGSGSWWSSTADGATGRYTLRYYGSSLNTSIASRYGGYYVRCIKS